MFVTEHFADTKVTKIASLYNISTETSKIFLRAQCFLLGTGDTDNLFWHFLHIFICKHKDFILFLFQTNRRKFLSALSKFLTQPTKDLISNIQTSKILKAQTFPFCNYHSFTPQAADSLSWLKAVTDVGLLVGPQTANTIAQTEFCLPVNGDCHD